MHGFTAISYHFFFSSFLAKPRDQHAGCPPRTAATSNPVADQAANRRPGRRQPWLTCTRIGAFASSRLIKERNELTTYQPAQPKTYIKRNLETSYNLFST